MSRTALLRQFETNTRDHQLNLSYILCTLGYKLWNDGALSLVDRQEIILEVAGELFYLKNSVERHQPEEEYSAIRELIAQTKYRMEKTAWQLEQLSSPKASSYLRGGLDSIVMFAEEATDRVEVLWMLNPVERVMGEVAKRCKRGWIQWSEEGLDTLLQLALKNTPIQTTTVSSLTSSFDSRLRASFGMTYQSQRMEVESERSADGPVSYYTANR